MDDSDIIPGQHEPVDFFSPEDAVDQSATNFSAKLQKDNNLGGGSKDVSEAEQRTENETLSIKRQAVANGKLVYSPDGIFEYGLAPNGERSHLSEKQWIQTRTKSFKQWFGDWEQDGENASKVVDENGEPLVMYHGTTRTFDRFDASAPKTFEEMDNTKGLFYLASDREFALMEYAQFKQNRIREILREFNVKFFNGEEKTWEKLVDKWDDFIRAIGTDRVNFYKKVQNRTGDHFKWTIVEFDGKDIFLTDEIDVLWDKKLPEEYQEQDYEIAEWSGMKILLPKSAKPVVMDLFVNSRNPIRKHMKGTGAPQEMDFLFSDGLIEKGVNISNEEAVVNSPSFGSQPTADSIIVYFPTGGRFALGFFQPDQVKSATNNHGTFSRKSTSIYQ